MLNRYLICFLFFSINSLASSQEIDLACQEAVKSHGREVSLSTNDLEFKIKNPRRVCDSNFTYEFVALPNEKWMITSWPTDEELGLNAQRDLFISPSKKSEATYIGSIPVDAIAISASTYRSITQPGGSIYETVYIVHESSIKIKDPSREFIISDAVCVYKEQNDSVCQTLTGTFDNPLCVYIYNGRKILKDLSNCSELSRNE